MFFLEPAELMGLQREERRFESREKRRPKDQERDEKKENDKRRQRHFLETACPQAVRWATSIRFSGAEARRLQ